MTPLAQVIIAAVSAGLPTLTVLVSLLINNQRLGDFGKQLGDLGKQIAELERRIDRRFDEQRELLRSEMYRVEQVLDARLKHLEEHL